ncbi:MAG: HAD-IA family hydrolase [Candidatus Dadabacteria bacterium]|nr:HAD-IA family hydrolase [Candidatus Dadabacteria bacterium]MDE0519696.1 HAD-IA family hydrolase [Candidatus Dadabacteria bacterium]MDE0662872.1 HAD-IA family hydrolase [Candidatus Dadabacteria bacterium]
MKALALETEPGNEESVFSRKTYDAVLFDLDGVITTTEKIHSACWKKTFDEFLRCRADESGGSFIPFSETDDYLEYVDGKPRYEGVRSFLLSRSIDLPEGNRSSPPGEQSVFGLGNRKNRLFTETLEKESPGIYQTSVALARHLKEAGFRLAVVSSSRNCRAVMKATGVENLFEVTVDGVTATEKGLRGKPQPDTFIEAALALGTKPARSIVIEDAAAGVAAGASGGFGLVIGVARKQNEEELFSNGADMVVSDLGEFGLGA